MAARAWNSLADLDELLLRCISPVSEEYLAEAVACYRGGAYRAAIVATWVAVTYDYIDKLNSLSLSGDTAAAAKLAEFDHAHQTGNVEQSLRLERELLDVAKSPFELLSDIEHADLKRLHEDRHRCAHPTHEHSGDPYQPTAEQARVHLRNAVEHLLSRPPVQGRAALAKVQQLVDSAYFPTDVEKAAERLASGPLAHARLVLARNAAVGFLKGALVEAGASDADRLRRRVALAAMHRMDAGAVEDVLHEKLDGVVDGIADDEWVRVLDLIQILPVAWEALSDVSRTVVETVVDTAAVADGADVLRAALQIPQLADRVAGRANDVTLDVLSALLAIHPHPAFLSELASRLGSASNFAAADRVFAVVRTELPRFSSSDVETAARAYVANDQFHNNRYGPGVMARVVQRAGAVGGVDESAMLNLALFAEGNGDAGLVAAVRETFPGVGAEMDARPDHADHGEGATA